jgi:hypothetical protein
LRDHLLNYYLVEAHNAVDKAQREELIPEEAKIRLMSSCRFNSLLKQQMGGFAEQLAQITEMAQQYAPQPPMPPDNSMQIAQLNAQLQGQVLQQRAQTDQAKYAT